MCNREQGFYQLNTEGEYLKRCRELANKQNNNTVHTSPAYIKLLVHTEALQANETYLLARLKEADENRIPEELFDGYAIAQHINDSKGCRLLPIQVNDVLNAIVFLIKERINKQ